MLPQRNMSQGSKVVRNSCHNASVVSTTQQQILLITAKRADQCVTVLLEMDSLPFT